MNLSGIRIRQNNFSKHGVSFEQAAEVFRDPLALTIADTDHSGTEARWITLGVNTSGHHVLVVHTFEELPGATARVRLISARRPTRIEIRAYEEEQ
jgi:uncharacterized protein